MTVLKIPFVFEDGKTRTITLQDPKSTLQQTEIYAFQEYMINNQVLYYGGYLAVDVKDGYLYETNEIPVADS